ncbi:MAG: hypothetical protein JKY54_16875 [Flavobacteriales bacterium]|nr:hypothetical protein [Flavobacteriales bacterium]
MNYQQRVHNWILTCFGSIIGADKVERNHRFLEESLELVQSLGCSVEDAHDLVDYVYGREIGEPAQEVGGVMNTLAALCNANGLDMEICAENEEKRVWGMVEKIRAKQAAKPKFSAEPIASVQGTYSQMKAAISWTIQEDVINDSPNNGYWIMGYEKLRELEAKLDGVEYIPGDWDHADLTKLPDWSFHKALHKNERKENAPVS